MSDINNPQSQKQDVIANEFNELRQIEMEGYETAVRKARNVLFLAGALIFVGEMVSMYRTYGDFDLTVFIIALVEAGLFVALALWTKSKPYTAVVSGLVLFIVIIILSAVFNGMADGAEGLFKALIGGFIWKIIILVTLIKGMADAKSLQEAKKNTF